MEEPQPQPQPHFPYSDLNPSLHPNTMRQQHQQRRRQRGVERGGGGGGKSCTHLLFKALLVAILIILLPLFPSQAPDFISESVITKFWELIHLLFIGIAVSYGLFSRRNNNVEIRFDETDLSSSKVETLHYDMSKMFQISSNCDDGFVDPNLSVSENGVCFQGWNSKYLQGESMVVVAQPNYGENRLVADYKPLGLPVRSLKSRIRKRESVDVVNDYELGSGLGLSSSSSSQQGSLSESFVNDSQEKFFGELCCPQNDGIEFNKLGSGLGSGLSSSSQQGSLSESFVNDSQEKFFGELCCPQNDGIEFNKLGSGLSSSLGSQQGSLSESSVKNPQENFFGEICYPQNEGIELNNLGSGLGSNAQSSLPESYVKDSQENYFGELCSPQNEGIEFNEAVVVSSPSPVPWRPRSGRRRRMRERVCSDLRPSSHFRPLSVDETQFESLRKTGSPSNDSPSHSVSSEEMNSKIEDECSSNSAKSFQGSYASSSSPSPPYLKNSDVRNSKSSQGSSGSDSPSPPKMNDEVSEVLNSELEVDDDNKTQGYGWSPASSGFPSPLKPINDQALEVMSSEREQDGSKPKGFRGLLPKPVKHGMRKTKSFQGSSAGRPRSPPKPVNDKASLSGFHARGHSVGSSYENDLASPKEYYWNEQQEPSESRREDMLSNKESELKSERKVSSPTKASLRGKSVRTIRSRGTTSKAYDKGEEGRKETMRHEGVESLVSGSNKPNLDKASATKMNTVPAEYRNREREETSENVSVGSEEDDAKSEAEDGDNKFLSSSREDADAESVIDATSDSNEVDKKAGEFIAKFREQIRLQKVASFDRSKGLKLGNSYLR
ncbi:hypothetical protein F8388_025784 [Cannabis sativa]|uniref:Uncharacterized protein n=1 Tax=Cannabis sativa TaxID=3483 RepID=A0A7J6HP42_CANSA|nr:hypothetical protein F8388_025784 [Cannabis sativa]KAF4397022.1 hypothetical protein G4B88_008868 [Cannabis sativa]